MSYRSLILLKLSAREYRSNKIAISPRPEVAVCTQPYAKRRVGVGDTKDIPPCRGKSVLFVMRRAFCLKS